MNKLMLPIALFGTPAAWVAQMLLSEPAVAFVCAKNKMYGLPSVINLFCLCTGLASTFIAYRFWRENRHDVSGNRRFMAFVGLLSSGLFIIVALFTTCSILLVSPCYHAH